MARAIARHVVDVGTAVVSSSDNKFTIDDLFGTDMRRAQTQYEV